MKKKTKITLIACGLALAGLGYGAYQLLTPSDTPIDTNATVSSNYYQTINKDWLLEAEIPKDSPAINDFYEMDKEIRETFSTDLENLASGKESSDLAGMTEFIEFYNLATDYDAREKAGITPIQPFLDDIENLNSLDDLSQNMVTRTLDGLAQPFSISVGQDYKNTSKKIITLSAPSVFLIDSSYYEDENSKKQLEELYQKTAVAVMTKLGYDEKDAEKMVEQALAFDSQIAPYIPTAEELSEVEASYNIRTAEEIKAYSQKFDFSKAINELVGQEVTEVNVTTPEFFEAFDQLMTEDNFDNIKSWLQVSQAMAFAPYLTEDLRVTSGEFSRAIQGIAEPTSKEDDTYDLVTGLFSQTLSTYYGQKYFSPEDKEKVTSMIDNIIEVYKKRLSENDWLSPETKAKAIEKLDSMIYYVGYPEEVPQEVQEIEIDPNKNMVDNIVALSRKQISYEFEHFNEPVDKTQWAFPSFMVNAFYRPDNNSINFPAAILSEPFYSFSQSDAQNYGAIGVVIGHEITHAFDNNGAKFDKEGNLSDWWTEADYQAFEEKTNAMIDQWDGIEIYGGKVNGKLTVGENIADAGGLSASLEALKTQDAGVKLEPFLEQYATIWRQKASLEYNQLLLNMDTHAPAELRVNQQLKNMPAFYDTYDIKEGDDMYLPEDQRLSIW